MLRNPYGSKIVNFEREKFKRGIEKINLEPIENNKTFELKNLNSSSIWNFRELKGYQW